MISLSTGFHLFSIWLFLSSSNEGGRLVKVKDENAKYNTIPVSAIDKFVEENNIDRVDVIKIDAERGDIAVIRGGFKTLHTKGVHMLTFECFRCLGKEAMDIVHEIDVILETNVMLHDQGKRKTTT